MECDVVAFVPDALGRAFEKDAPVAVFSLALDYFEGELVRRVEVHDRWGFVFLFSDWVSISGFKDVFDRLEELDDGGFRCVAVDRLFVVRHRLVEVIPLLLDLCSVIFVALAVLVQSVDPRLELVWNRAGKESFGAHYCGIF